MTRSAAAPDGWADGAAYERFMGRWSRLVADQCIEALDPAPGLQWLDVGCGTGALSAAILARADPAGVHALDRSPGYAADARIRIADDRARFAVCDGIALPVATAGVDVVVSGLVLNFVADPVAMLREMARAVRTGGTVAVYVWDYADGMQFLRRFWDAAISIDGRSIALDEGRRFPVCSRDVLLGALETAGLTDVSVTPIDVPTRFESFDAYWTPFLGGQGPAGAYVAGLDRQTGEALRERLRATLDPGADGSIALTARAWFARGGGAA